jgi:hypothetical protein
MKDKKGFKQYKNGSKGKNPGQAKKKKKNPAGGMDVCVVLYKDSSMEHEGQKDLKVQKMDQRRKRDMEKKNSA